jgi:GTP 3',8-cyclase
MSSIMNLPVIKGDFPPEPYELERAIRSIQDKLDSKRQSLEQAIIERALYFRVSLIGTCNLKCTFCHNEGAPVKGIIDKLFCFKALREAYKLGFKRVQFTGGEPLLHPHVEDFVHEARRTFDNVGLTTNGTHIIRKIDGLIKAGITRIHISLQVETLREEGSVNYWGIPKWLKNILSLASEGHFSLRLNLPVPFDQFSQARGFLSDIARFGNDIQVFSILSKDSAQATYPVQHLNRIVEEENSRRRAHKLKGFVSIRGYRPPSGIRCYSCGSFSICREQSHSLRLGADHILRPCLASRKWDIVATEDDLSNQIKKAALLALDYVW